MTDGKDLLEFGTDGKVTYKILIQDEPAKYENGYLVNYNRSYYSSVETFNYTQKRDRIEIANLLTGRFLSSEQFYVEGGATYGKVKGIK